MESVSDRHSGDLNGTLKPLDPGTAVTIRVFVPESVAEKPAAQHAAWMAVNLLARADGIVSRVEVDCPDVTIRERTIPFGRSLLLAQRLIEAGSAIGVVPVGAITGQADRRLVVSGHTGERSEPGDLILGGAGWWGGVAIGQRPHAWAELDLSRGEPIGPYVAACLAVAEVFLTIRAPQLVASRPGCWGWNSWAREGESTPTSLGPAWSALELAEYGLAGVGAVGAAWMHTLWATPRLSGDIVIADADAEGVSLSNLNRGLLFRHADVDRPKATTAAEAAVGAIAWAPFDGRFEAQDRRPRVLVSAVDSNAARDVLQNLYLPYFLSGSTRDLRAEIMIGGAPGVGACLRCFNPPETTVSDDEIRERALAGDPDTLETIAFDLQADMTSIEARLKPGACDALSDRLLERLRRKYGDEAPSQFAVGFGSALAGVLLAAETIRFAIDARLWPKEASERITFQFQHPAAGSNRIRPYARDPRCPKCGDDRPAFRLWESRR